MWKAKASNVSIWHVRWFDELLDVVAANLATVRAFATAHYGIALVEPEGT